MSDSDDTKGESRIPQWQMKSNKEDDDMTKEEKPVPETSRATIVEQAKKFLEEDEVRNATTDKKVAFLESKGLEANEIEQLLGLSRNTEASSTASTPEISQPKPNTAQFPPTAPHIQYAKPVNSAPPIITYPEFLTTPPHPEPLVTKARLLTTLYAFSAISFLLYGTKNYLVTPMLESLTSSRLSLSSTAQTNLSKLISRLESVVSEIPDTTSGHKSLGDTRERNGISDGEESDEDPSEMFHRDIGVQTSLPSSPISRSASPTRPSHTTVTENQASRLSNLKTSIEGLVEDSTSEGYDQQELETTIGVLREYCDSLAYVAPAYNYSSYGGANSGREEKNDEIAKVKAGIIGVKGVLLSARSFPGGVRR